MRAAAVQLNSTEDRAGNLQAADDLTHEAAAQGARLVLLPEKWSVLGSVEALRAGAERLDGPAISWACAIARDLGIDLVAGSIVEHVEGKQRGRNTSVHVGSDGEIHAVYRKLHLFDVEVAGIVYCESDTEEPGDAVVTTSLADGTVAGMSVCYDVRFPELYRAHADGGARILLVPAAFTETTTRDHWEPLLRARAIENQCYVVAANQIGDHGEGRRSGGRSLIVDPWGVVLAEAPDQPSVIVADLDFGAQDDIRRRFPALTHRRPELYERTIAS